MCCNHTTKNRRFVSIELTDLMIAQQTHNMISPTCAFPNTRNTTWIPHTCTHHKRYITSPHIPHITLPIATTNLVIMIVFVAWVLITDIKRPIDSEGTNDDVITIQGTENVEKWGYIGKKEEEERNTPPPDHFRHIEICERNANAETQKNGKTHPNNMRGKWNCYNS